MYSKELLQPADLQPYISQPETLINQSLEFQLTVANYLQTPIELLEILVNQSCYLQVVEAAKLHVTYIESTGEIGDNWREIAEIKIKNAPLQQNDRLVAELLKIAPVPEYLISEWIPGHRLIEGLENPYLSKQDKVRLLERLGKSTIIEERLTAAAHPDTPRGTLEILAGDLELPIRIAVKYRDDDFDEVIGILESQHQVASEWETLALELTELAGSKWSWIRQTVARNFNAPVEVLRELAEDGEEKVQLAVARNLATPGEVLDLLVNHGWGEVTESIAKHPNASEDALIKLIPRCKDCIRRRVNLTPNILEAFAEYDNKYFSQLLIKNLNTPTSALEKLITSSEDLDSWFRLAKHPNAPVSILEKLANHYHPWVRIDVYKNPNTPDYLKKELLKELSDYHQVWEKFRKIKEEEESKQIGYHNNFSPEYFQEKLFRDDDIPASDYAIASHPKTPPYVLEKLSLNGYESIVAKNPNTPAYVLYKLSQGASSHVRECIAKNPSTPQYVLIELMNKADFIYGNTYENWTSLAYEYPNFPKKELYRVLLDKEISEQNQKARGFIEENCNNIKQFKDYISKNIHTQTYNHRSVKPDIRPEYFLPKKISPTLKGLTSLYNSDTDDLPTLLSEYIQSQTPFVRFISLIHPLIPIEFLQQNSQSLLWWERYAVAINSATPLEIRERLTEDCNYIVKAAAQDSLKNDLYL